MKRWRRPLILIALLLLAGAVVNVVVAWVLGGAPPSWTAGGPERVSFPTPEDKKAWATGHVGAATTWGIASIARVERGLGWQTVFAWRIDDEATTWHGYRVEAGWPAHSLWFGAMQSPSAKRQRYSISFEPPRRMRPNQAWFDDKFFRGRVPLAPLPAGFALNTLFYTAILALPLSFFPVRRRLRARRGRCPKCGYDRAGLRGVAGVAGQEGADLAAPCPECGAAR